MCNDRLINLRTGMVTCGAPSLVRGEYAGAGSEVMYDRSTVPGCALGTSGWSMEGVAGSGDTGA